MVLDLVFHHEVGGILQVFFGGDGTEPPAVSGRASSRCSWRRYAGRWNDWCSHFRVRKPMQGFVERPGGYERRQHGSHRTLCRAAEIFGCYITNRTISGRPVLSPDGGEVHHRPISIAFVDRPSFTAFLSPASLSLVGPAEFVFIFLLFSYSSSFSPRSAHEETLEAFVAPSSPCLFCCI